MLKLCSKLSQLSFSGLMAVYVEGNRENGEERYPHETQARQLALAEEDFYDYLRNVFFATEGTMYALWEENGEYVSALRLEPYRDGLLLEGLETMPQHRGKGCASMLIRAVLEEYEGQKIYSHVGRKNLASLAVHGKAGFRRILDHAVYIDGSVNNRCCTFLFP